MNELVCLDLDCSDAFVDRLRRAWDDGDAVFPLDRRLPRAARDRLVATVEPTIVADESGDTTINGRPVEPGDALVVATSGTTGEPRAAVLTHDAVIASALATSRRLGVSHHDTWFACLPPAHVGGLSVITRALLTGTPCITAPRFTVNDYVAAAGRGATLVSLVATALARVDPSMYRTIVLGGSRPPEVLPPNVVTTYGMTETGSGVVYDGVPLDGVEVDIRDGVVHLRAPMLLRAYRDGSVPVDPHGWFRTGDIGSFDDSGLLHVQGREGDLIVTGGENVWPDAVEAVLARHPAVSDCCVAGVPDPQWGHAVHAWVVLPRNTSLSIDEARDFVKQSLPPWCAPRELHVVGEIPRTALGKPQRARLVSQTTLDT